MKTEYTIKIAPVGSKIFKVVANSFDEAEQEAHLQWWREVTPVTMSISGKPLDLNEEFDKLKLKENKEVDWHKLSLTEEDTEVKAGKTKPEIIEREF